MSAAFSLSSSLWNDPEVRHLARETLLHPFVTGLASGTLSLRAFKCYVAQDALFLKTFDKAYAAAQSCAADIGLPDEVASSFAELRKGLANELKLHTAYAAKLGIILKGVTPLKETELFTDFLIYLSSDEFCQDKNHTVLCLSAGLTACVRLYAFLGQALNAAGGADTAGSTFRKWVEEYSSDAMESLASRLEATLDACARHCALSSSSSSSPEEGFLEAHTVARKVFTRALRYEFAFFSAPIEATRSDAIVSSRGASRHAHEAPDSSKVAERLISAARVPPPRVLVVAGSSSGGGAGVQADVKACAAAGVFTATAITAVAAQNTQGIQDVLVLPAEVVDAQMASVLGDLGADVVKTGMLPTAEIAGLVAGHLERLVQWEEGRAEIDRKEEKGEEAQTERGKGEEAAGTAQTEKCYQRKCTGGVVTLRINGAKDLAIMDKNLLSKGGSSDPYVQVELHSPLEDQGVRVIGKTDVVKKSVNPVFCDSTFSFSIDEATFDLACSAVTEKSNAVEILFKIFDKDVLSSDDPMGESRVLLCDIFTYARKGATTTPHCEVIEGFQYQNEQLEVKECDSFKDAQGTLNVWAALEATFKESARKKRVSRPGATLVVVDPVMVNASGDQILEADAVEMYRSRILPTATLITPNIFEAQLLLAPARVKNGSKLGKDDTSQTNTARTETTTGSITDVAGMEAAARALAAMGPKWVLVKGGRLGNRIGAESTSAAGASKKWVPPPAEHWAPSPSAGGDGDGGEVVDVLCEGSTGVCIRFEQPRTLGPRQTDGKGCALASAIAAELACGRNMPEAVREAKRYVAGAIALSANLNLGAGDRGPMNHHWQLARW